MSVDRINYSPPKPRLNTIYSIFSAALWGGAFISLFIFVYIWYSLPNSWASSPGSLQPHISTIRWVYFVFVGCAIVWFIGMIWAVAKHNQRTLDAWLQEQYGLSLPNRALMALSTEIWDNRKRNQRYQSKTIPVSVYKGVTNIAVVSDGEDTILMNMDTGEPFVDGDVQFKDFYVSRFRRNMWLNKNEIIHSGFTYVLEDKQLMFVWSKMEFFQAWFQEGIEEGRMTEDIGNDIYVTTNHTSLIEVCDTFAEENNKPVFYVIDWDTGDSGCQLSREEFLTLVSTDKVV